MFKSGRLKSVQTIQMAIYSAQTRTSDAFVPNYDLNTSTRFIPHCKSMICNEIDSLLLNNTSAWATVNQYCFDTSRS